MVCVDYPRPDLDNTANFLEAAYFSSTFRASPRPAKPLKVVIAGAGDYDIQSYYIFLKLHWVFFFPFSFALMSNLRLSYSELKIYGY